MKFGALLCIFVLTPQFSIDLQLIGGVIILQTLPAVGIGLFTAWLHRYALLAGLVTGLTVGLAMLYQIPALGPNGKVARPHFGGSSWSMEHFGIHNGQSIYVGLFALAANLVVAVALTPALRALGVPDGTDITWRQDYGADEGDPTVRRLGELVDGGAISPVTLAEPMARHGLH